MSRERDDSTPTAHIRQHELAGWLVMMVGGAFLPGLIIALCVVAIVAIVHLAG